MSSLIKFAAGAAAAAVTYVVATKVSQVAKARRLEKAVENAERVIADPNATYEQVNAALVEIAGNLPVDQLAKMQRELLKTCA